MLELTLVFEEEAVLTLSQCSMCQKELPHFQILEGKKIMEQCCMQINAVSLRFAWWLHSHALKNQEH